MNPMRWVSAVGCAFFTCTALLVSESGQACTGITLHPTDSALVTGRTLEFGRDTQTEFIIIPRGKQYVGTTPDGQPGLTWTTRYGAVGGNAAGLPHLIDGINERGLSVDCFGSRDTPTIRAQAARRMTGSWRLGN